MMFAGSGSSNGDKMFAGPSGSSNGDKKTDAGGKTSATDAMTLNFLARVSPFLIAAGLAYSRRTQPFHVLYLRQSLSRTIEKQRAVYSPHKPGEWNEGTTNPVLRRWLEQSLAISGGHRVLHVVAGDDLVGKTSTVLQHLVERRRRGIIFDLTAVVVPDDVRKAVGHTVVAQSGMLWRLFSPTHVDIQTSLLLASVPRQIPLLGGLFASQEHRVIVVNHAENLFVKDGNGNDASWLLWVLKEASKNVHVLLLCSDEAAQMSLQTNSHITPFLSFMFCPEPPHKIVAQVYSTRFPQAPQLGNDVLRKMLRKMQRGLPPGFAASIVLEQAAMDLAERLELGRLPFYFSPSFLTFRFEAFLSSEKAEEILLKVECALIHALSRTGRRARKALLQAHDPAAKGLMLLGLLRIETGRDMARRLRVAQDSAIVWALSDAKPRKTVHDLIGVLESCEHRERHASLVASLQELLASCLIARVHLGDWMRDHMDGVGPDVAIDWRALVDLDVAPPPRQLRT
ncbi:unnamed protein product [Polarella glacialis]|uniref:Uncharacterized protein n=1 Tax=Polarella glacialis TaxID=89957 RepID=A0A813L969_POLGL|nr:unnamed protein product [Polarella glacialis]